MKNVSYILAQWPTRRTLHEDAKTVCPAVDFVAIHRWHQRQSIPAGYWAGLVRAANVRGIDVTLDDLAEAHSLARDLEVSGIHD